jgi:hypothetical protein
VRFGGRHEDFEEARQAIRDILYLYQQLTDYLGIVGDHDTGTFQPFRFLDCTLDNGYGGADTEKLLHQGSAVALLSLLIDVTGGNGIEPTVETYRAALDQGRFDHVPTARAAVIAGLESDEADLVEVAMAPHLDAVYEEYVLAYFAELSRSKRGA